MFTVRNSRLPDWASCQTPQTLLDWVNCDEVDSVDWLWFKFITYDFASLNVRSRTRSPRVPSTMPATLPAARRLRKYASRTASRENT